MASLSKDVNYKLANKPEWGPLSERWKNAGKLNGNVSTRLVSSVRK